MHKNKNSLLIIFLFLFNFSLAQNYQAINGSSYAGSLAPSSNPAGIVHVPYAWDITPFSVQLKQATNAFKIENYSLLSSPKNIEVSAINGTKQRFEFTNQDIRILNTRISLNSKAAIAFGANVRNYIYATTSNTNYQDTLYTLAEFMKININHLPLSGESKASTWAELYASYARTIIDDGDRLITGGITLKVNRALAGGYGAASGLSYIPRESGQPGYILTEGSLQYGYSSNFDNIDSNKSTAANRKAFLQTTRSSISADMGLEYIRLTDEDKGAGEYAYDTKIGISIIDIGKNKYRHGNESIFASNPLPGVTDTVIEQKFQTVTSVAGFNDSLASISQNFRNISGDFYIYQPTRLVVNVDQHIRDNFFINAELTIQLLPIVPVNLGYLKDMNLLAITPRWELKSVGVYMPLVVNTRGQTWVGGAFKAGPVLMGTHNLANLFTKNNMQTGGFYLALTIRPGKGYDRQGNYPKYKQSKRQQRNLECPKF